MPRVCRVLTRKKVPTLLEPPVKALSHKKTSPHLTDSLTHYFHDLSLQGDLLTAEEEAALAALLREEEERTWCMALSFAPLVHAVAAYLKDELAMELSFQGLKSAATRHLGANTEKTAASLHKAASRLAALAREADPDQEALMSLLCELERLAALENGTSFKKHLRLVHASRKNALRLRNEFVERNLGLVVSIARRYQFSGLSLSDLIQEGNLGLLKAVSRFDDRRGFRFSTYATWWIRHAIGRGVADKSRTVRVPVHVMETNQKINKERERLRRDLDRAPSNRELAKALGISETKLDGILESAQGHVVSLDAPVNEERDRQRQEVLTDPEDQPIDEVLARRGLYEQAGKALEGLAPLEIEIIHRRFGLSGSEPTTLQDIANSVGKSRERIRQIQEGALNKMRQSLLTQQVA